MNKSGIHYLPPIGLLLDCSTCCDVLAITVCAVMCTLVLFGLGGQKGSGRSNPSWRDHRTLGKGSGYREEPRACRLLLEFVPMSSMAAVCGLVSNGSELVIVHFPVLLLSVLPMLENVARLHSQLLTSEASGGDASRGP